MRPVPFPEQNDVLRGGSPDILDLPIFRDGNQIISCWKLSPDEVLEVAATGVVYLSVMGGVTQPPVVVMGQYPFIRKEN